MANPKEIKEPKQEKIELTEEELAKVAGGLGGNKRAQPIGEQAGKMIHCSKCNRDYNYYDIRFNQCPKGHFVA